MTNKKDNTKSVRQHKYRVSVYLGKELYETISGMAKFLGIPMATATRILLETGKNIAISMDNKGVEEVKKYGKSKV